MARRVTKKMKQQAARKLAKLHKAAKDLEFKLQMVKTGRMQSKVPNHSNTPKADTIFTKYVQLTPALKRELEKQRQSPNESYDTLMQRYMLNKHEASLAGQKLPPNERRRLQRQASVLQEIIKIAGDDGWNGIENSKLLVEYIRERFAKAKQVQSREEEREERAKEFERRRRESNQLMSQRMRRNRIVSAAATIAGHFMHRQDAASLPKQVIADTSLQLALMLDNGLKSDDFEKAYKAPPVALNVEQRISDTLLTEALRGIRDHLNKTVVEEEGGMGGPKDYNR